MCLFVVGSVSAERTSMTTIRSQPYIKFVKSQYCYNDTHILQTAKHLVCYDPVYQVYSTWITNCTEYQSQWCTQHSMRSMLTYPANVGSINLKYSFYCAIVVKDCVGYRSYRFTLKVDKYLWYISRWFMHVMNLQRRIRNVFFKALLISLYNIAMLLPLDVV